MSTAHHNETVKGTLNVLNSLKLDDTVKDMKACHKTWPSHLKQWIRTDHQDWLSNSSPKEGGTYGDLDEDGKTKNTSGFKGTGPRI